jgi:Ca2+-transporting ATPase
VTARTGGTPLPQAADPEATWAAEPGDALAELGSSERGLAPAEVARRLQAYGPNELRPPRRESSLTLLLRQFRSPLIYILLVAGLISLALGELIDAGAIAAVLVFNAAIGFTQELRATRELEALRRLTPDRATVVREGDEQTIEARELVPGDVVLLDSGARVPADLRVLHAAALEADESLLTGESVPVSKSSRASAEGAAATARPNMLIAGTVVTRGRARALAVATGEETELGRIAESVAEAREAETPLQRRMRDLARTIGAAVLAISVLGFVVGIARGGSPSDLLLTLVALAVSAIPEGLPIVLTITLAVGVRRMAARHALIRRLPAVETLGSCTVIGSDKTGTLTQNRMTVREIWAGGRSYEVSGAGYSARGAVLDGGAAVELDGRAALRETLVAGALCNDASIVARDAEYDVYGDPTEVALLIAAAKAGLDLDGLAAALPRRDEIPFESEARFAATVHADAAHTVTFVKGAPERIVAMCEAAAGLPALDAAAVLDEAHRMAAAGLRVLAMASREDRAPPEHGELRAAPPADLTFLGLQAMIDPPRPEVAAAVRGCQAAGIRVLMITGDHATTALAIGRQLGIAGEGTQALTGAEIDALDDAELLQTLQALPVCARTSPQNKLRIVSLLQDDGEVVAVTGDGVNDAPALKAAHIGVAMGLSGTDVAREAAEMVVTDDNFASIFAAVREGRVVFDNVRKATFYLVSSGVAEVAAVLASIALAWQLPFVPAQLLWLNVVTNGVQDVGLAFEPGEPDVLEQPPRAPREPVISRLMWERTAIAALCMAAGTLLLFRIELDAGHSIERARTVALTSMVVFQAFHVGNSRSEWRSVFRMSPFSNRFLIAGTAAAVGLHIAALSLPPTQAVLRVEALDPTTWLRIAAVASLVIVAVELHKRWRRPQEPRAAGTKVPTAA